MLFCMTRLWHIYEGAGVQTGRCSLSWHFLTFEGISSATAGGWWAPKRKHADQISEKRVMWQIITNRNLLLSHKNTAFEMTFTLAKNKWQDQLQLDKKENFIFEKASSLGRPRQMRVIGHHRPTQRTTAQFHGEKLSSKNYSGVVGIHYSPFRRA